MFGLFATFCNLIQTNTKNTNFQKRCVLKFKSNKNGNKMNVAESNLIKVTKAKNQFDSKQNIYDQIYYKFLFIRENIINRD